MSEEILETTRRCYEELKKTAEILITENQKMRAEIEKMRAEIQKQKEINKKLLELLLRKFSYKEEPPYYEPNSSREIFRNLEKLINK